MKKNSLVKQACYLWLALTLMGCAHQYPEGKHLFILAGQSNMAQMDPYLSFIPAVEKEFGKQNVIVVKDAVGGQCIYRWVKNWKSPTGSTPADAGDLYNSLMEKVNTAISNQTLSSITLVWMQGESDGLTYYYADAYEASLLQLYAQLQEDLHRQDINWVIGRISDFDMRNHIFKRWTSIRETQVRVAESDARFSWIDTDDLNDGAIDPNNARNSGLHYTEAGYRTLGQRFADSAIELIKANAR